MTPEEQQQRLERRLKREARRAAQRLINEVRAKKMHALRLASPPADKPLQSTVPSQQHFIGCSGWYYWHWNKLFYPPALPRKDWFSYYARFFDTVKLNAPFYSWPTVATVKTWLRQAEGTPMVYTIKVCELITHIKRLTGTKQLIKDFGYIADLLGPRFGCFLFQFPPSFDYSPARLRRLVEQLEPGRRNVVEFRHRSWWSKRVYDQLRSANITFCSSSGPRLPEELITTSDTLYIRFHGTTRWYRHDYTEQELLPWIERIKRSTAKQIWAYFNNDRDGHAIRNAQLFRRLLSNATGKA